MIFILLVLLYILVFRKRVLTKQESKKQDLDYHINVEKINVAGDHDRWKKLDALEQESTKKKKKSKRFGMKFSRIFGNTVGQIVLSVLSILWVIPLFYLFIHSFRAEPGA